MIVPAVPALRAQIERIAHECGLGAAVQVISGQSHTVLAACDVTLIASGTATLEAALFKRPMVIGYRMQALSWQLMRRKQLQPWVGLPNILCGEFVVPELIQDAGHAAGVGWGGARLVRCPPQRPRPYFCATAALCRTAPQFAAQHFFIGSRCDPTSPYLLSSTA